MSSDEDDDETWEEMEQEAVVPVTCLFCETTLDTATSVFSHCQDAHSFNMAEFARQHHLDCYGYIKLINYVRVEGVESASLSSVTGVPWDDDKYMRPTLEDDPLLQYDVEELTSMPGVDGDSVKENDGPGEETEDAFQRLLIHTRNMERQLAVCKQEVDQLLREKELMRSTANDLFSSLSSQNGSPGVASLSATEDESYVSSYGHFSIHQEMLKDRVRTESYRDAILNNKDVFRDKIVLDVGCGTGILSMMAAQAGAKLVIAVDMSDIIDQAIDIVRENGLEDKVRLIRGRIEDVALPCPQVDIIISEWMGYFLLFESMLDSVLWARDHYLTDGGLLLPNQATLNIVAIDDQGLHTDNVGFWDDVYGFKMSCMRTALLKEASVALVKPETVVSSYAPLKVLDISSCTVGDLDFSSDFSLQVNRDSNITALVGCFDIAFDACPNKVKFSTSPDHQATHWKQTLFLLPQPITCEEGDTLQGVLRCSKNPKDPRSLVIKLTLGDSTHVYYMQ